MYYIYLNILQFPFSNFVINIFLLIVKMEEVKEKRSKVNIKMNLKEISFDIVDLTILV
jgi:hypothetical protein